MNIKKFKIENFRSLKSLKVDDFGNTTIFYGDNNAGKSNILNALSTIFMRKPKLASGDGVTDLENFYEGIIQDSQTVFFNNDTNTPISFEIDVEVSKSEITIDSEIAKIFKDDKTIITFIGNITFLGLGDHDYSEFKIISVRKDNIVIYSNDKDVVFFPSLDKDKKKQPQLSKAFAQLIDVFNDCVYVVSSDRDMHETTMNGDAAVHLTPKTFKKFLYSLYLSPKKFHLFEEINSVYSQAPFNFGTISFSNPGEKLEIMIKEKDFRLPIKHLGSGALQALYIISSIVCSKSKIFCLEELEQNLSPNKQFQILKKIQGMIPDSKLPITQLLISSHSSVYAKPKLGTIYYLEKANGQTVINAKESQKISSKLQKHFATSITAWDESQMAAIKKILKEEHDFE